MYHLEYTVDSVPYERDSDHKEHLLNLIVELVERLPDAEIKWELSRTDEDGNKIWLDGN